MSFTTGSIRRQQYEKAILRQFTEEQQEREEALKLETLLNYMQNCKRNFL